MASTANVRTGPVRTPRTRSSIFLKCSLKGNQGTLHQGVIDYVDQQLENDFADVNARMFETEEAGGGRQ
jgi:hypothetical protein